ncbi:MAG: recombinase RecT [Faecousia sp.]
MNEQIMTAPGQKMSLSAAFATPTFQAAIHNALNDAGREKTFVSSIIAASTINPVLQECTPKSVLSAALVGESLKLCPSPQMGHYYFVPYENKVKDRNGRDVLDENGRPVKQKSAQFQMGYKGYIQLALRSGQYRRINVLSIKKGELKKWDPLTEEIEVELIEDEDAREQTETIGYYAAFEYLNGFRKAMYWSRSKMERHALRYSKGYAAKKGYTFWEKDFDAMAYKTMLRQLISKWGIMTVDMQMAFEQDVDIIQNDDGSTTVVSGYDDSPAPADYTDAAVDSPEAAPEESSSAPAFERQVSLNDL